MIDWGSVPAWVGSTGTIGGLIFTGIQIRRYTNEKNTERADRADHLARCVAVQSTVTEDDSLHTVEYDLQNFGDYPVHNTIVCIGGSQDSADHPPRVTQVIGALLPGQHIHDKVNGRSWISDGRSGSVN